MLSSKLYTKGQRCVILCEGFYEWQTTKPVKKSSERAAYYIHVPQDSDDVKIFDKNTWSTDNINLLKMAGLYDIWTNSDGDKIYSYTVITFQSSDILSWLHDRMPAILETEEQITDWLDFGQISNSPALAVLKPAKHLCWYQVSNEVNNSRNKSTNLNRPLSKEDLKKMGATSKASKMLTSWLIKKETPKPEDKNQARNMKNEEQENIDNKYKVGSEKEGYDNQHAVKRENEESASGNEEKKVKKN